MAELSPAAQAVMNASFTYHHYQDIPLSIAAAIRAAADQVVPPDPCGWDCCIDLCVGIRAELLAIAAELEGQILGE